MRWAKSYSIVDHQLLRGGYMQSLSHEALILYLFLLVVGDCYGKSFYRELSIMSILRFSTADYKKALGELINHNLVEHKSLYFWVKNISYDKGQER